MPSPMKKRRKNGPSPPPRMRNIQSFFKSETAEQVWHGERALNATSDDAEQALSDETFARKLQAQWDQDVCTENQAREGLSTASITAAVPSVPNASGSEIADKVQEKGILSLQSLSDTEDTVVLSIPLDESPLTFDLAGYSTELHAHWAAGGGDASYALLTRAFVLANATTSRIKIVDTLVNFLRVIIEADPSSVLPAVWLTINSVCPPYIGLELGLGGSAISKALKGVYGLSNLGLKTLYDKHGDAGDVAFEAKKRQSFTLAKPKPLKIKGVYHSLMNIATAKGPGSQEVKQRIIEKLLRDARGAEESRYIVRTLAQNLRIGAVKTTMLIALARAFLHSKPKSTDFNVRSQQEMAQLTKEDLAEMYNDAEEIVKASYARHPNYGDLVASLLEIGATEELLVRCGLQLHIPLRPMLGSITRDLSDMLTKLQERAFTCEYKYDGQRAQVHCDKDGKVSIFSRHLERMTEKYPDIVSLIQIIKGDSVSDFILEGEVVAVVRETGELQPFQTLTNRAKKSVSVGDIKVNVCLFAFDLMYLNGEALLDRPLRERRELLRSLFVEIPKRFTWVKSIDAISADSELILEFFKSAIDSKCEGIMVKVLDSVPMNDVGGADQSKPGESHASRKPKNSRRKALLSTYEPDKRLESWLKVKKDYSASSDTLDLVPVAGWHGQGRKAKWWSPILLAVRNPDTGALEAVTKCISGFTDKFYQANKDKYAQGSHNVISRPAYVEYYGEPDVWFEPQEVWETAFADITLSPVYTAAIGLVSEERGLSLRFPRFVSVREDKSIDEASTSNYLALLWRKQDERSREEENHAPEKSFDWQEE